MKISLTKVDWLFIAMISFVIIASVNTIYVTDKKYYAIEKNKILTKAIITEFCYSKGCDCTEFKFNVSGKTFSGCLPRKYQVNLGDTIHIYYNSKDPEDCSYIGEHKCFCIFKDTE